VSFIFLTKIKLNLASLGVLTSLMLLMACGDTTATPTGVAGQVLVNNTPLAPLSLANCASAAISATPAGKGPAATPNPNGGVRVEVPAGYRLFASSTFPYALAHPESWQVREAQAQGNLKGDLLIGEKTDSSVAAITIISEKLNDPNQDSNSYFQVKLKEITAGQNLAYEKQTERNVGGATAYGLAYNTPSGQPFPYPVQSLQMAFTAAGRGWVVSFTVTPTQAGQYCAAFSKILDSWTFTGLVK